MAEVNLNDPEVRARLDDEADTNTKAAVDAAMRSLEERAAKKLKPAEVLTPLNWRILVKPRPAPDKLGSGLIEAADETREREEWLTDCGQILAMGASAFMARTAGGVELREDPNRPKVGDWVVYAPNAGIRYRLNDGQRVVIITDTAVDAVVKDPADLMFYM